MENSNNPSGKKSNFGRRRFMKGAAVTAGAFTIVPRHVIGKGYRAPSDTLNIAGVGIGGMGKANLDHIKGENIVALCDVDWKYSKGPLMHILMQKNTGTGERCMRKWEMILML